MWFEELVGLPLIVLEKESNIHIIQYNKSSVQFSIPGNKGIYKVLVERNKEIQSDNVVNESERVDVSVYHNKCLERYCAGIKINQCLNKIEQITNTLIG